MEYVGYGLLAMVSLCGVIDFFTYRIPNSLTITLILAGVGVQVMQGNYVAMLQGFAIGSGVGLLGVILRGMGGGDLKLLVALGIWLGPHSIIEVIIIASLIGIVWGMAKMIRHKTFIAHVKGLFRSIYLFPAVGCGAYETSEGDNTKNTTNVVPFGSCLAMALTMRIFLFN